MALWLIVAWLVVADVVVGVVGVKKQSGTMMIASGAWALFFVGCGFVVNFDDAFVMFAFPLIGAFGATMFVLGLKTLFRPGP